MSYWSTSDIQQDGQADWLIRLYEKAINGIREVGGLPSGGATLEIEVPTLADQARIMRYRDQLPPGYNPPTGVMDWVD